MSRMRRRENQGRSEFTLVPRRGGRREGDSRARRRGRINQTTIFGAGGVAGGGRRLYRRQREDLPAPPHLGRGRAGFCLNGVVGVVQDTLLLALRQRRQGVIVVLYFFGSAVLQTRCYSGDVGTRKYIRSPCLTTSLAGRREASPGGGCHGCGPAQYLMSRGPCPNRITASSQSRKNWVPGWLSPELTQMVRRRGRPPLSAQSAVL